MDDLFRAPLTPLVLPRAYWLNNALGSQLLLITPSTSTFSRIEEAISKAKPDENDMENHQPSLRQERDDTASSTFYHTHK